MSKTTVLFGERLGKEGELRLGCSALIFDAFHEKVLLTQRTDNGQWCLPSGRVEAGESVSEAIEREVWEETGLEVRVANLMGVYSDPNRLVVYPDGNKAHIISLNFKVEIIGGAPGISDETIAWGYFDQNQVKALDMLPGHLERILDSFTGHSVIIK